MAFVALRYGDWRFVFLIYGGVSLLSVLWLFVTPIKETIKADVPASFSSCIGLLKNKLVLAMVIAIFLIVGADVGMNSNIQGFLIKLFGVSLEKSSYSISIYFTALMVSRFAGAILLRFLKPTFFLVSTTILAILGTGMIIISTSEIMAQLGILIVGLGAGNLFPLVFSIAINKMPTRANEISGLLIMAIVGGAIVPPVMGTLSSNFGVVSSVLVLMFCFIYVLVMALFLKKNE
jgi:fucose permease